jgi:hypothetical protein
MKEEEIVRHLKLLAVILEKFNGLEARLASIINRYVGANGNGGTFLEGRVLHNSVVSYASKVKLVQAIGRDLGVPKLDRDSMHKLGEIRNSFAHGRIASSVRRSAAKQGQVPDTHLIVESIKGDGSVKELKRHDALEEFKKCFGIVSAELDALEAKMAKRN